MTDTNENLPATQERPKPQIMTGGVVGSLVPQSLDEAYRVAQWCASSGLTPRGIDTPEKCLYVIMAGADLRMPPVQALQSFALINGRLSIWGDAIPALLWSNGFKIKEWFESAGPDYPDEMIARCRITRPDGEEIEGEFSVADAKEARLWTKDGPWQTSKKRMLKMRARAFCARDGAPDLLRGLYIAEEAQDIVQVAADTITTGTGMVERLKARAQPADVDPAGFNVRTITEETAAAKPKGRKKAEPTPATQAEAAGADPKTGEIIDAEVEEIQPSASAAAASAIGDDDLPEGLKERPTETANVQSADAGPASSASATDASTGSAAEASGEAQASDERSSDSDNPDDVQEGCAAPGDLYYHTDLPQIGGDGCRAAFKDGVFFSRLSPRDDLLIYDQHAPLVSQLTQAEPEETINAADIEALGGAIGEFWTKMQATTSWLQIKKPLLTDLNASDDFNELEDDEKDALRVKIVEYVRSIRDPVDQAQDATFFRLWVCTQHGADGADAITGTMQILQREPIWQKVGEALEPIAKAHIARCREER